MAEVTTLVSDLTNTHDAPRDPVRAYPYEWEGERLRIDLTASEYAKWKEVMAPYVAASRPNPESRTRSTGKRGADRDTEGSRAKAWARSHGAEMGGGRCPEDVLTAFRKDDPELIRGRLNGTASTG